MHNHLQFPPNADKPDLVLGEAFVPGSDEKHFCQPTSLAVSEATGTFFVADGYCNSRILKYSKDGKLLKIISEYYTTVKQSSRVQMQLLPTY